MSCFDQAPEFITEDNRQFRILNPVSKELMEAKHEALLPPELVKGKTILDLGCCLGATGHWCLSNGAAHYTGVELQAGYADAGRRLFEQYWPGRYTIEQASIEDWLRRPELPSFDIVCALGVIYAFTDYYWILKRCTEISRSILAIEGMYPVGTAARQQFCGVQFVDNQPMNIVNRNVSAIGRGTRISPKGLKWIMAEFSFTSKDGVVLPRPIMDVPDVYNRGLNPREPRLPVRYMMRFDRQAAAVPARSISEDMQRGLPKMVEW